MSRVVLDANVLVGWLDEHDSLRERATELIDRLENDGHSPASLDFLVEEAISVLARRAEQRRQHPPSIGAALSEIREWYNAGLIGFHRRQPDDFLACLDVIENSNGRLNFNDARLVIMQRNGEIEEVASFDADFASVDGFRLIS
jgi:predicted nucleic acid-binding protein